MAQPFRVQAILDELSEEHVPEARIAGNLAKIDRYFASDRLEDILDALDAGAAEGDEWAATEAATIRAKSPMACKVSLKLLLESPYQLHFVDEMRMEYGIMVRLIHHPDFREGVRALLIDKDNEPNWHPTDPQAIGDARRRRLLRAAADRGGSGGRSISEEMPHELRNHPGRAEGRGDVGHAQPPAGAQRAQLDRCSRN